MSASGDRCLTPRQSQRLATGLSTGLSFRTWVLQLNPKSRGPHTHGSGSSPRHSPGPTPKRSPKTSSELPTVLKYGISQRDSNYDLRNIGVSKNRGPLICPQVRNNSENPHTPRSKPFGSSAPQDPSRGICSTYMKGQRALQPFKIPQKKFGEPPPNPSARAQSAPRIGPEHREAKRPPLGRRASVLPKKP